MISKAKIFYREVIEAAYMAEEAVGRTLDYDYRIGGHHIRLHFAGESLVSAMTPAFSHLRLETNQSKPELVIHLWDSASTNVKMPSRPWELEDIIVRGEIRGFNDASVFTALAADVGSLSVWDIESQEAVFWIRSVDHLPQYECGAPLRWIIHWWMRQRQKFLIHAGAVCMEKRGVLLVGKGGSGKSSTALSCLLHGWKYLADDYCLFQITDLPYAYSVYGTAKLAHYHLKNFPLLENLTKKVSSSEEKALLFLSTHWLERLSDSMQVQAIVVPKVTSHWETKVFPISPIVALKALAPSSLFQLPATGTYEFEAFVNLTQAVPCFVLELGSNLNQIPGAIEEIIK